MTDKNLITDFQNTVSRVALIDSYEDRFLFLAVVRYLKKQYNSYVCVYVQSVDAESNLKPYLDDHSIDAIKVIPPWKKIALQEISENERSTILSKAVQMEKFLKVTYNEVRMTRRDLGIGFYLGAYYYPRTLLSEKATYEQTVNAFNFIFEYWKNEFEQEKISLVINGLKEPDVVAHALSIPFRYLFSTRIDNYFYWARSVLCEFPEVKAHYQNLKDKNFAPVYLEKQFFSDIVHKKIIFGTSRLKHLIYYIYRLFLTHFYRVLKRRQMKGYYFFSALRFSLKRYRDTKRLTYPQVKKLSDFKGKKFVYFPLAAEPEMSLHWMSPEYISQLTAITSIARDLPADTILLVKEAVYSLGSRSDEFYGHIKRLKNAFLIDIKEQGLDVISASQVIVTVSGTSGLEGAIMGKPVILLGRHNYYDFLDHVFLIKQEEQLRPALQRALDGNYDKEKAKVDGARLKQAAINASFDLKEFSNVKRDECEQDVVKNVIEGLKKSLSEGNEAFIKEAECTHV